MKEKALFYLLYGFILATGICIHAALMVLGLFLMFDTNVNFGEMLVAVVLADLGAIGINKVLGEIQK